MSKYFMYVMACGTVNHQYAIVLVLKILMVCLIFHLLNRAPLIFLWLRSNSIKNKGFWWWGFFRADKIFIDPRGSQNHNLKDVVVFWKNQWYRDYGWGFGELWLVARCLTLTIGKNSTLVFLYCVVCPACRQSEPERNSWRPIVNACEPGTGNNWRSSEQSGWSAWNEWADAAVQVEKIRAERVEKTCIKVAIDTQGADLCSQLIQKVWVACSNCYKMFNAYGDGIIVEIVWKVMDRNYLPDSARVAHPRIIWLDVAAVVWSALAV